MFESFHVSLHCFSRKVQYLTKGLTTRNIMPSINQDANSVQQKIIETASKLFMEHGCKKVTMDGIAAYMHISKRTIYEQFEDKESLLKACLDYHFSVVDKHVQMVKAQGVTSLFVTMVMLRYMMEFPLMYARAMDDIMVYYPKVKAYYDQTHPHQGVSKLTAELKESQSLGLIRAELNLEVVAFSMVYFAQMVNVDTQQLNMPKMRIVSETLFTYLRGMLTKEGFEQFSKKEQEIRRVLEHKEMYLMGDPTSSTTADRTTQIQGIENITK